MKGRRSRSARRDSHRRSGWHQMRAAARSLGGLELLEARQMLAADGGAALVATATLQVEIVFREDLNDVPGAEINSDSLRVDDTFFVEILVGDFRADAAGVSGLGLDISWPTGILHEMDFPFNPSNPTSRLVTANFPLFRGGTLSAAGDMIDELSGAVLPNSGDGRAIGVNQLERFSLLRFQADAVTSGQALFQVALGQSLVAFADAELDYVLDIEQQTFQVRQEVGDVRFLISGTALVNEGQNANYTLNYEGVLLAGQTVSVRVNLIDSETNASDYGDLLAALSAAGTTLGVSVSGNRVTFTSGGPTSLTFALPITNDILAEGNEGFQVALANPTSAGGGSAQIGTSGAPTTIAASEAVQFSISGPASGGEGATLSYTINYTGDLDTSASPLPVVRVDVQLFDLAPTQAADHGSLAAAIAAAVSQVPGGAISFANQTLSFTAGGPRSLTFQLPIIDDTVAEGAEQFEIRLSNPRSTIGANTTLAVPLVRTTIIDNEVALVRFDLEGTTTVVEGQTATYILRHDGTLTAGQTASVAIALQEIDAEAADHIALNTVLTQVANATNGVRFENGRVIFEAGGPASITFGITTQQDTIAEGTESFRIVVSSPLGPNGEQATIGATTVTTSITDNDQIAFRITGSSQVNEGASASYSVSYTGQLEATQSATIDVSIANVSTTSADYSSLITALANAAATTAGVTAQGSSLVFTGTAATLNFTLPIVADTLAEPSEQFRVRLSNVSTSGNALAVITTDEVTTTIINVAPATVSFSLSGASQVTEGQSASYTLALAGSLAAGQSASVNLAITHVSTQASDLASLSQALATAAASTNGVSASGTTVTFSSGAPASFAFQLAAIVDGIEEPTEAFQIGLANAVGTGVVATIAAASVSTSILDNDEINFSITGTTSVNEGSNSTYTISYAGVLAVGESAKVLVSLTDISTTSGDHGSLSGALFTAANSQPTIDLQGTTLTFRAGGATSLSFSILAFQDGLTEPNEAYRVTIAAAVDSPVPIVIGNASVQTTIRGVGGSTDARLAVRLVRTATVTDALGQVSALPSDAAFIDEWTPFFIEVWASSQDSTVGIQGVDVDLAFESDYFVFDRLTPGPAFGANLNATPTTENIRLFGSIATSSRVGADQPVLVGRVAFRAAAGRGVPLELNEAAYIKAVPNNNWAMIAAAGNADVTLEGGQQPGTIDLERQPTTDLYPVMYDLDDNGQIGFSDLAVFTASFLKVVSAGDPETFKSDFDRTARVGFGDLALFSANFFLNRNTTRPLDYPTNFPQAFASSMFAPPPPEQQVASQLTLSNLLVWLPPAEEESSPLATNSVAARRASGQETTAPELAEMDSAYSASPNEAAIDTISLAHDDDRAADAKDDQRESADEFFATLGSGL